MRLSRKIDLTAVFYLHVMTELLTDNYALVEGDLMLSVSNSSSIFIQFIF